MLQQERHNQILARLNLEGQVRVKDLSKEYHGDNEVYIFYDGTNKLRLLNKKDYLMNIYRLTSR